MDQQKENRFTLHGSGGELFGIYIVNVLLTMVTLGVYTFWAQVKITKYLYNQTEFLGQRFDYHATGKERFIGFLMAAGIFLGIAAVFGLLFYIFVVLLELAFMVGILVLIGYGGILFAVPWMLVGQRRYLLSRSSWSSIRFRFVGTATELLKEFVIGAGLTSLTFGIYFPWYLVKMNKFFIGKSQFGNQTFDYDGDGGELFKIYLKGILLTIVTFGIYSFWMQAELERYTWKHTTFMNNRFRSTLEGGDLFGTTLLVFLMVGFSFGIAFPWALLKLQRLYFNNLYLDGEVDLKSIEASRDQGASALADGMSDVAGAADAVGGFL